MSLVVFLGSERTSTLNSFNKTHLVEDCQKLRPGFNPKEPTSSEHVQFEGWSSKVNK